MIYALYIEQKITIFALYTKHKYKNQINLKSASNLNGNLNCSKELEHYAS